MATPAPTALDLAEQHRVQQNRMAAAIALLTIRYLGVLQPKDAKVAQAGKTFLAAVLPVIAAGRSSSADMAARYWADQRELHLRDPGTYAIPGPIRALNYEQATRSMAYTGVVGFQDRLNRGLTRERALELTKVDAAGAAQRLSLAGGRDVMADAYEKDSKALGYSRATRPNTCYFCAMLASRGPVYKEDSFDESDARFTNGTISSDIKVHDSCGCFLVPMYSRSDPQPGSNEAFNDLWISSTAGYSGQEAIKAFRRAYEGRRAM